MNEKLLLPAHREAGPPAQISNGFYPIAEERPGAAFSEFLAMLRRRARLIAAVFIAVSAAGIGLTLMQTPIYSATALLKINPNPDQIVPEKQALANSRPEAGMIDSEIEMLKSPALAARLVRELSLDADPEWNPMLAQSASPAAPAPTGTEEENVVAVVSEAI